VASRPSTIGFLLEQAAPAGRVRAARMFGAHALYCDDKVVALVFSDELFVKPTPGALALAADCEVAAPHRCLRPHILVPGDRWEDQAWLVQLFRIAAAELPVPKRKSTGRVRKSG
jgi:TfoX/Sxy family transcriptional regulator of competence genes